MLYGGGEFYHKDFGLAYWNTCPYYLEDFDIGYRYWLSYHSPSTDIIKRRCWFISNLWSYDMYGGNHNRLLKTWELYYKLL